MTPQEKLKIFAFYLPYELKVQSSTGTIYLLNTFSDIRGRGIESRQIERVINDNMKPILRPLYDLTKEIEHNGEKFIPLERLFAYSQGVFDYDYKYVNIMSSNQVQIEMLGHRNYFFEFIPRDNKNNDIRLHDTFRFNCFHTNLRMENKAIEVVKNPYLLFEKLLEWHFNAFNLPGSEYVKNS